MSHCRSRFVRQGSQDCETTKMIDTNKDIGRALDAAWQLQEVDTYNVKGSGWQRIGAVCVVPLVSAQERHWAICRSMSRRVVGQ